MATIEFSYKDSEKNIPASITFKQDRPFEQKIIFLAYPSITYQMCNKNTICMSFRNGIL